MGTPLENPIVRILEKTLKGALKGAVQSTRGPNHSAGTAGPGALKLR